MDPPVGNNDDVDANNQPAIPDDDAPISAALSDGDTTVTLTYLIETEAHDPANPPGSATEANQVPSGYTASDESRVSVRSSSVDDVAPLFSPGDVSLRNTGAAVGTTIHVRPDPGPRSGTAVKVGAAVGVAAATAAALVVLLGGGDGNGSTTTDAPRATVTTIAAAPVEPATPALAAAPTVQLERFTATFDPGTYTTTYDAAFSVDARELDIDWELRPHEDCGVFDSFDGRATWIHPHESQRGQVPGFPDDRYCQDPRGTTGHTGGVAVLFGSGDTSCEYAYPGGSSDGVDEQPDVLCQ